MRPHFVIAFLFFFMAAGTAGYSQGPPLPPPMVDEPGTPPPTPPKAASETEWTVWKNERLQISYPPKWAASNPDQPNVVVVFFAPSDEPDFNAFVGIYRTDVVIKSSTEELVRMYGQFHLGRFPSAKLISSRVIRINDIEAGELSFAEAGGQDSRNRMVIVNAGNSMYMIDILYTEATTEKYETIFSEIVKTIKLL